MHLYMQYMCVCVFALYNVTICDDLMFMSDIINHIQHIQVDMSMP